MDECKYGKYCMCSTCAYQMSNTNKKCCTYCSDCIREDKQVHDIWTCSKYIRKSYLRNTNKTNTVTKEIIDDKSNMMGKACVNCSNNPINGGSGICNCVLGSATIYC